MITSHVVQWFKALLKAKRPLIRGINGHIIEISEPVLLIWLRGPCYQKRRGCADTSSIVTRKGVYWLVITIIP